MFDKHVWSPWYGRSACITSIFTGKHVTIIAEEKQYEMGKLSALKDLKYAMQSWMEQVQHRAKQKVRLC